MNSREIARRRMHNQHLWGRPCETPREVVRSLGAMQAQEFPYAKWSVAQRAKSTTEPDIDTAFADGEILRTHILRQTWHFVARDDLRWLMALSGPRVNTLSASYYRRIALDDALADKTQRVIARALGGGEHLTRKDLREHFDRAGIDATGTRFSFIMMRAELDALICSGAPRGKQQTYALFDDRVPKGKTLDRDEALAELTKRYFTSRGPATVKDFSRWSSLTMADGRRGLEQAGSALGQEVAGGRTYWFAPSRKKAGPASPRIDLVQLYDETIMGYSESRDALGTATGANDDSLMHAVLLDGQLIGRWKLVRETTSVRLETNFSRRLKRDERQALDAAVGRYARFLELPVALL